MVDWQARSLQKRQLIESYANAARRGTYWGIGSSLAHYGLDDAVSCPPERTAELARIPARFKALPDRDQEDLINWVCRVRCCGSTALPAGCEGSGTLALSIRERIAIPYHR